MKQQIKPRAFSTRDWQKNAFRKAISSYFAGEKNFLCVATPGAGKTKFALVVAHEFLLKGYADRIVVVTPTTNLKDQWARESAEFAGIDIDPDINNARQIETGEFLGEVITYSLLGNIPDTKHATIKTAIDRRKTLVIFDEIHHAGDSLTWGNATLDIFENAVFRLLISGTAFRTDDNPIPYVKYDNNVSKADYVYSYDQAIRDNVCRPVYFHTFDGIMKWKVDGVIYEHSFRDYLSKDQKSKRLKTALSEDGKYVRDVITEANKSLDIIRKTHPTAGGLIFCTTQEHAKEVAKLVKKIIGVAPQVIISEDTKSNEEINRFKDSKDRWLVSVRMVSEGVDIPRLRVGVYLTNIKAELFFRQAVGRFVRVLKNLTTQDAHIFIPMDIDIVKIAEKIQEERDHALEQEEEENRYKDGLFPGHKHALQGEFVPIESTATSLKTISVNVDITTGMKHRVVKEQPLYMQKVALRDDCNAIAKQVAIKQNKNGGTPDWFFAHRTWLQNGGQNIEIETIEQLRKRKEYYKLLLKQA